jgi:hypothetical protein
MPRVSKAPTNAPTAATGWWDQRDLVVAKPLATTVE